MRERPIPTSGSLEISVTGWKAAGAVTTTNLAVSHPASNGSPKLSLQRGYPSAWRRARVLSGTILFAATSAGPGLLLWESGMNDKKKLIAALVVLAVLAAIAVFLNMPASESEEDRKAQEAINAAAEKEPPPPPQKSAEGS
jgi:hypothetical protein